MKKKFYLLFIALSAMLFTYSCKESTSDEYSDNPLVLSVDKPTINLDVQEIATFSVTLDGQDVTQSAQIVDISLGGYDVMTSNEFTTLRPGTHTFFASYDGYISDPITVYGSTETGFSDIYYRRNVIFKFTGTWCSYCPSATTAINSADILYPDRLVEIAVHQGDDLEVTDIVNALSVVVGGLEGYPTICIDANKELKTTGAPVASNIVTQAQSSLADEPTTVGIQLESKLDGHTLTVDVENHFTQTGYYKLVVAFLQSGFNYDQTGSTDDSYRQNHVIRWFFSNSATGDPLGDNGYCTVGEKVQTQYSVELDSSVSLTDELLETFDIVAYVVKQFDETTYHINNAAEVGINELSDYQFEPITE